ncbi:MAG: DUF2079 domain-containing protein, partial [Chloroflexi bacterium]|nr:DUF2079 domain-containing protein [Chloroflexota bacterium]
ANIDLAHYDRVAWNSTQGRLYEAWEGNHLASHVTAVPLLTIPVYVAVGGPKGLLFVQSLFLAVAALPLFAVARRRLAALPAVVLAIAFLVLPNTASQHLDDFHETPLAAVPFFLALLSFEQGRFRPFLVYLTASLLVIEYHALALSLFGVLALVRRRPLPWVIVPIGLSAAWLVAAYLLVMPSFRATARFESAVWGLQYYSHLGSAPGEILLGSVRDPLASLLANPLGLPGPPIQMIYLRDLLLPFLFVLPVSAPEAMFALTDLLKNLPTGHWAVASIASHHTVLASMALMAATVAALGRLQPARPVLARGLASAVLALAASAPQTVASALTPVYLLRAGAPPFGEALALVPPDAPVVASAGVISHLSRRRVLYSAGIPEGLQATREHRADYILLDVGSPVPGEQEVLRWVMGDPAYSSAFAKGRVALFALKDGDDARR